MAENKAKDFLAAVPVPVWIGLFGLLAANKVWGDLTTGAKELGKKTGEAFTEVERSKSFLINLPEFKSGYFEPLKGKKKYKLFTEAAAGKLAQDFQNVKGFFNDNEDLLYAILGKITYKTQLAQVAQKFTGITGKNLGAYIASFTNTNERHRIEKIINEMPSGIV